ncbi:MAG: hypothetical protein WC683_04375 [bacterium]
MRIMRMTVEGCARCGKTHADLLFKRFKRPAGSYTWWAACPKTGEPILMRIREKAEG